MSDPAVADFILKSVIGGAIIALLVYFISQLRTGVWIARREYDAIVTMKDNQIAEQKAEIARLEAKLEKIEVTLRESASTMNQVIGAAVRSGPNG